MSEPVHFGNELLRGELRNDVDMSRHVSWRAGGRAERSYKPADLDDLAAFLQTLSAGEPLHCIGLGSNLLVRDGGLRGTVLLMHAALSELRLEADGTIYAQAGVPGAKLARFAALHSLGSAEFFAGIPGTLGGMLAMNAGCYGGETWNTVARVQVMNRSGELRERTPEDYEIGYRHVALRNEELRLGIEQEERSVSSKSSILSHQSSQEFFVGAWLRLPQGDSASSREQIKSLLSKRIASQPLQMPNAGSVFRNPPNDHAARLIEACGLKGKRMGGAQVSEKHANFIVNTGGASAADIENLIAEVRTTVAEKTGIELHPEVRIIGESKT